LFPLLSFGEKPLPIEASIGKPKQCFGGGKVPLGNKTEQHTLASRTPKKKPKKEKNKEAVRVRANI